MLLLAEGNETSLDLNSEWTTAKQKAMAFPGLEPGTLR